MSVAIGNDRSTPTATYVAACLEAIMGAVDKTLVGKNKGSGRGRPGKLT